MGIFDFFKGDSKKNESKDTLELLKSKIWDLESHYSRQFGLEKVTKDSLNSIQFHDDGKGMLFVSKNINLEKPEFLPFNYTLNHRKLIKIFEDGREHQENIDRIDEEFLIVYSHETKNKRTFKSKNPREELKKADSSGILESLFDKSLPSTEIPLDDSEYDSKSDESTNGVSDEERNWTIYSIELSLGLKMAELFRLKKDEFNPLYNLEISIDVSESIGVIGLNEYLFLKSLVKCIDELNKEDENWKLNDSDENRLYDLRYNSIIHKKLSKDEHNKFLSNVEKELELIISVLSNKLNDYDNLKKEIKFQGYDMFKKIISKSQILSIYVQNLILENQNDKKDSDLRVNFDDTEDIGIVTHYKGKPLTGIAYRLHDNGNLLKEYEYLNGLCHGKGSVYDEDGNLTYQCICEDDEEIFELHYENNKIKQETIFKKNGESIIRTFDENGYYVNIKGTPNEEDTQINFPHLDENFNEDSEHFQEVFGLNYTFMEKGGKQFLVDYHSEWFPDYLAQLGELKEDEGKIYYGDKLLTGIIYSLHVNGNLRDFTSYKNGIINGISKSYKLDGDLHDINYWIDGKSLSSVYDPSGLND